MKPMEKYMEKSVRNFEGTAGKNFDELFKQGPSKITSESTT